MAFVGSTKIMLPHSNFQTMKQLCMGDIINVPIYSSNLNTRDIFLTRSAQCKLVKQIKRACNIVINKTEVLTCDLEQMFFTEDGSRCLAKNLKLSDRLLSTDNNEKKIDNVAIVDLDRFVPLFNFPNISQSHNYAVLIYYNEMIRYSSGIFVSN